MSRTSYDQLIAIIKKDLGQRSEFQKEIYRINAEGDRDVHGTKFSKFADKTTRDEFISDLMAKIEKVDELLSAVAGRNKARHKELIELLVELFEIEQELGRSEPKFAGGFRHQQKSEIRKDEINQRVKEIIDDKEACQAET